MKLGLGTVQFGLPYGIANSGGQVSTEEVNAILTTAQARGIDMLDTAIAYGDSEARLGAAGVGAFHVVSKLPKLEKGAAEIESMVRASLARLHLPDLYGLLLHRSEDLCGDEGEAVYAALVSLKAKGLVRKIGISIYDPAELNAVVPRFALDLVQAPYNLLDRRIKNSGWLDRLKASAVEVHTRSAMLQGLLLMKPSSRPAYFSRWSAIWARWDDWLAATGAPALAAALAVPLTEPSIDRVVVGVDSQTQLRDIVEAASWDGAIPQADFASDDTDLLNPARWNSQ